jgi:hypothetical protein
MEEKRVALFLADFDHQRSEIEKIYDILDARYIAFTREEASSESVESSGYWLHNLYCAYEDLFKIVSAFWENSIENVGTFHKNLIRRMVLNIEGVRPALLSDRSFRHLDELRSFRHVFRHAYSYGLDGERVFYLIKKVLNEKANVLGELNVFREKVASVLNGGQE